MRAAIYCRISQDRTGEGLGVDRQLEDCKAVAKAAGWDVTEIYVDNDVSATSGRVRPEYRRMLKAIESGDVEAIVAWAPDRLYRKLGDLEELIPLVESKSVAIRTCRAGDFDLATPLGKMIARILGAVATGEGDVKVDRWKRSVRQRREQGRNPGTGSRMFGYTRDMQVIPAEAAIARRLADDVIAGVPLLTIARLLDDLGILTTRGTVWRPGTLRQYLANPRLAGFSTLRGQVVGDGQWEPVLDRDTWETVRALLNSRTRGAVPRRSLLNGLIFCGGCGHRMITSGQRGKRTYRCPNRPGMAGCGRVSGNAEPIEELVEAYAKARLDSPKVRGHIARLSARGAPKVLAEIASIEARIVELEEQLEEPGIPVAAIVRAIDRSRERLEECQRQLTVSTPVPLPRSGGEWPTDLERRRRLVDLVVGRVELAPAKPAKWFDPERVTIKGR